VRLVAAYVIQVKWQDIGVLSRDMKGGTLGIFQGISGSVSI
jgi:hypothetical protein